MRQTLSDGESSDTLHQRHIEAFHVVFIPSLEPGIIGAELRRHGCNSCGKGRPNTRLPQADEFHRATRPFASERQRRQDVLHPAGIVCPFPHSEVPVSVATFESLTREKVSDAEAEEAVNSSPSPIAQRSAKRRESLRVELIDGNLP